jgi:hypothetical protein
VGVLAAAVDGCSSVVKQQAASCSEHKLRLIYSVTVRAALWTPERMHAVGMQVAAHTSCLDSSSSSTGMMQLQS